jgi:hypothetical protein
MLVILICNGVLLDSNSGTLRHKPDFQTGRRNPERFQAILFQLPEITAEINL